MDLVQDETFSGADWALEEVTGVRYEDCAFHDVDWSEARLTGCVFTHCTFGNVRFNAATLDRVAIDFPELTISTKSSLSAIEDLGLPFSR